MTDKPTIARTVTYVLERSHGDGEWKPSVIYSPFQDRAQALAILARMRRASRVVGAEWNDVSRYRLVEVTQMWISHRREVGIESDQVDG